jgi:nicotinamidase-related amidase
MIDKALLLIIDAQYDFCDEKGSLYVPGAEKDMERLASFIGNNNEKFGNIVFSQDTHHVIDISHPAFWKNQYGKNPSPFTQISVKDLKNGNWLPVFEQEKVLRYLKRLDEQGEFPHVIWPEHCIDGSQGAAIVENVMYEVKNWARTQQQYFTVIQKGKNPLTEHFGILKASVSIEDDENTWENTSLLTLMAEYNEIYIAGEAQSHCVATTIKQLLPYSDIANKIVVLKNCMSPVSGFEHLADDIYQQLKSNQFIEV